MENQAAMAARYRTHLQAAVATSAAPYGYTLTVWTSGAEPMRRIASRVRSGTQLDCAPGMGSAKAASPPYWRFVIAAP